MMAVDSKCPVLLIRTSREEFDKCVDGGTLIRPPSAVNRWIPLDPAKRSSRAHRWDEAADPRLNVVA